MVILDGAWMSVNEAVTLTFAFIVILQVGDVPEHPPDQPANEEPASGLAVRFTTVPWVNVEPNGLFVIVPVPEPNFFTVRVYLVVSALKLALIEWFAVTLLKV